MTNQRDVAQPGAAGPSGTGAAPDGGGKAGGAPEAPAGRVGAVEESLLARAWKLINFSWANYIVTLLIFEALCFIPFALLTPVDPTVWVVFLVAVGIVISVLHFSVLVLATVVRRLWNRVILEKEINSLQEQLETGDFFTTLIRINFRYIDKYYLQTQVQADKSFYLSAAAAVVSLLLILAGVAMLFFASNDSNRVTAATVTTAAGVLGEFIAAVFFYLYNRTVTEMSKYHQKLVLTQNISLALKMAEQLPDAVKPDAQIKLIECLSKDINMYLSMQVLSAVKEAASQANGKS
ncbi:MAG: hypothetical protein ABW250_11225 [Pyrinomonadaceae bacterium]